MSLTSCLKKLGKNVSAEDRKAIQQLAAELRKQGKTNDEAAAAAVRQRMQELQENIAEIRSAPPAKPEPPVFAEAQAGESTPAALAKAAANIERLNPDLMVQLEGMDKPMRIGEVMAMIKEEARTDTELGRLVEVAAECSLTA